MRFAFCFYMVALVPLIVGCADDAKDMEGKWQVESMELKGVPAPPSDLKDKPATIAGGKLTMPGSGETVTLKLNASKNPKEVDVDDKGKTFLGIYKFDAGKLYLCFDSDGKTRPTEFKSPVGSAVFLMVLKKD